MVKVRGARAKECKEANVGMTDVNNRKRRKEREERGGEEKRKRKKKRTEISGFVSLALQSILVYLISPAAARQRPQASRAGNR